MVVKGTTHSRAVGQGHRLGRAGDDLILWNSGDGNDILGGGDGTDTVQADGTDGADTFTADPNGDGTRVILAGTTTVAFTLDIGGSETLDVNALGGDDTFTGGNGLAALIGLDVDGGEGNDTLNGGNGADTLAGWERATTLSTATGATTPRQLGDGNDTFVWDPGDASDVVEGGTGSGYNAIQRLRRCRDLSRRRQTARGSSSPATSATSSWTPTMLRY